MWLEHWYLVWNSEGVVSWWCNQEVPGDTPDKDKAYTHSTALSVATVVVAKV